MFCNTCLRLTHQKFLLPALTFAISSYYNRGSLRHQDEASCKGPDFEGDGGRCVIHYPNYDFMINYFFSNFIALLNR